MKELLNGPSGEKVKKAMDFLQKRLLPKGKVSVVKWPTPDTIKRPDLFIDMVAEGGVYGQLPNLEQPDDNDRWTDTNANDDVNPNDNDDPRANYGVVPPEAHIYTRPPAADPNDNS